MSTTSKRSRNVILAVFVLLLLGAGVIAVLATSAAPVPDNNTDINDNDNVNNQDQSTVTVWQSIYVKNADGDTYWYNAPEPFYLKILGSQTGDENDLSRITQMANTIWMQPQTDNIDSWEFSCKETIQIQDLDGNVKKTICDSTAVTANGHSGTQGQNTQITSSWLTESQLQQIINLPSGKYNMIIAIGDIYLTIHTASGETKTLTSGTNGTIDNVLQWLIEIQ